MLMKINEIKATASPINVVAFVQLKSEIKSYGVNGFGKYMFLHLFDGDQIKLIIFGGDCQKLKDIKVSLIVIKSFIVKKCFNYCFFSS